MKLFLGVNFYNRQPINSKPLVYVSLSRLSGYSKSSKYVKETGGMAVLTKKFSDVGENKQLLIAVVGQRFYFSPDAYNNSSIATLYSIATFFNSVFPQLY